MMFSANGDVPEKDQPGEWTLPPFRGPASDRKLIRI
jgi:hypothetical protein